MATQQQTNADTDKEPRVKSRQEIWYENATFFAWAMMNADFLSSGDLAQMRRMDPDSPGPPAFWTLLGSRDLLEGISVAEESKWALIINGIAIMTRQNQPDGDAHDPDIDVGHALFEGPRGDGHGYYSEMRLNALLRSEGESLRKRLIHLFQMMRQGRVAFHWGQMALFILYSGYDERRAEYSRRRIARGYYSAKTRSLREPNRSETDQE